MEENVKAKIEESYNALLEKPNIIYNIFKDFFGEEFVDMQGYPNLEYYTDAVFNRYGSANILEGSLFRADLFSNMFILVRFPEVRVTNEYDKYIDIWELYVKVEITYSGKSKGVFTMNRAEYDHIQLLSDYLHSHIAGINTGDFSQFKEPCLGQGPIRDTLLYLAHDFDELRWQLLCLEISKYIQVESLSGGPYRKLENVGANNLLRGTSTWTRRNSPLNSYNVISKENIKEFVKWLITRNKLKFNYNGSYGIAMSYLDWLIFVSNEFIEWFNYRVREGLSEVTYEALLENAFLRKGIIKDGVIYYNSTVKNRNFNSYIGSPICTFKGQEVTLTIRGSSIPNDNNMSTFINNEVAESIYTAILQIINYNYGNNNSETQTVRNNKKIIFF